MWAVGVSAPIDLKRHLETVHQLWETKIDKHDLKSCCARVEKNLPRWPVFAPITEDELTDAFMHGWAVRNERIPNRLTTGA